MTWYLFALGAALSYTVFQIIRKKGLSKTHALAFESVRSPVVFLISLIFIPFIDWNIPSNYLIIVYITSLIATVGILLASKAFHHSDISLVSPLSNLRPAFVAIIAFFFLSETIGAKEIIGILILLISAYVLESDHHIKNILEPIRNLMRSKYSIYYIIAVLMFAIWSILHKFIFTNYLDNIFTYMFFIWLFIAINFNIVHGYLYGFKDSIACIKKEKFYPLGVAFFSSIGNLLEFKALTLAKVSLVQPIIILTTLLVVLFGGKFFHEKNLMFRLAVSALMLVGTYLIIM